MKHTVTISARKLKRYELAEETCKAYRTAITTKYVERTGAEGQWALDYLLRWMSAAGKSRYDKPKGWPK